MSSTKRHVPLGSVVTAPADGLAEAVFLCDVAVVSIFSVFYKDN